METLITLHPAREQMVIEQGATKLLVNLRDTKIKICGTPSVVQLQKQPLALMALVAAMSK